MTMATRDRVLIALVCGLCYMNFGGGVFHYDDFHSLVDNPHVRSLANIPAFFADPSAVSADAEKKMYRPLLLVTSALQYAAHGYEPLGFLLVNLLLHVAASLLVGALATTVLGSRPAGLAAALFFAAHPLASAPVNYISSRSESMGALAYLGGFWSYLSWRSAAVAAPRRGWVIRTRGRCASDCSEGGDGHAGSPVRRLDTMCQWAIVRGCGALQYGRSQVHRCYDMQGVAVRVERADRDCRP